MYDCASCMWPVLEETRKGHGSPWNWSYRRLWASMRVLGISTRSSRGVGCALQHWPTSEAWSMLLREHFRSSQSSTGVVGCWSDIGVLLQYRKHYDYHELIGLGHWENAQQCPSPCVRPSCYGTPSTSHSEPKLSYIIFSANEIQALTNPDLVSCYPGHCLYINKHWVPCCIKYMHHCSHPSWKPITHEWSHLRSPSHQSTYHLNTQIWASLRLEQGNTSSSENLSTYPQNHESKTWLLFEDMLLFNCLIL